MCAGISGVGRVRWFPKRKSVTGRVAEPRLQGYVIQMLVLPKSSAPERWTSVRGQNTVPNAEGSWSGMFAPAIKLDDDKTY